MINSPQIIIIGGGAAGMAAAIAAKQVSPRAEVMVLEKNPRMGKKLLATGNGRCNIGNEDLSPIAYFCQKGQSPDFVKPAFVKHPMADNILFFAALGLLLKTEDHGKIYPYSNQASSVLDRLRLALSALDVKIVLDSQVVGIKHQQNSFEVDTVSPGEAGRKPIRQKYKGDKLILTCGGVASPQLSTCQGISKIVAGLGHKLTGIFPSLVQVKTENFLPKALKGTKIMGTISLYTNKQLVAQEEGEILFTEYGVSGPPVFQLSRLVSHNFSNSKPQNQYVEVNLMPEYSQGQILELLLARQANLGGSLEDYFTGMLNKRLGQQLLKACGIAPLSREIASLTNQEIQALAGIIKALRLEVCGTTGWQNAQVMAGGLDLGDFDPDTLESKLIKGFYAAGEILDIDGRCGGYNLGWAWSSGRLAGYEAAKA